MVTESTLATLIAAYYADVSLMPQSIQSIQVNPYDLLVMVNAGTARLDYMGVPLIANPACPRDTIYASIGDHVA